MASKQTMEQMRLTSQSVTFLCDADLADAIQKEADEHFEGNFSQALRKIIKVWNDGVA